MYVVDDADLKGVCGGARGAEAVDGVVGGGEGGRKQETGRQRGQVVERCVCACGFAVLACVTWRPS